MDLNYIMWGDDSSPCEVNFPPTPISDYQQVFHKRFVLSATACHFDGSLALSVFFWPSTGKVTGEWSAGICEFDDKSCLNFARLLLLSCSVGYLMAPVHIGVVVHIPLLQTSGVGYNYE